MNIPDEVKQAWDVMQGPVVLTTISIQGIPNSIYATCVALFENNKVLIANNKFFKTLRNMRDCDKATVLFITPEKKAYQLKGAIKYETEGAAFINMKKWNRADLPGYGVAVVEVDEIYSGAEQLI